MYLALSTDTGDRKQRTGRAASRHCDQGRENGFLAGCSRLTCVSASGSTFRRGVGRGLELGGGCAVNRRKCRATVAGGDEDLPTLGNTPGRMRASREDAAAPLAPCPYGGRTPLTRGDVYGTRPPNPCETRGLPRVDVAPLRVKLRSCVGGGPYAYKLRAGDSGPTVAHERATPGCCCADPIPVCDPGDAHHGRSLFGDDLAP